MSLHELRERVEIEWDKISKEVCVDLRKSMPRRVAAVLKAKGSYIKYKIKMEVFCEITQTLCLFLNFKFTFPHIYSQFY